MRDEPGDFDDLSVLWGVPLDDTPAARAADESTPLPPPPEARGDTFLLRGGDLPSDGVYRPRLRGFGDAA